MADAPAPKMSVASGFQREDLSSLATFSRFPQVAERRISCAARAGSRSSTKSSMSSPLCNRPQRLAAAVVVTLLVAMPLTGCGASSKGVSSTSSAARTVPSGVRVRPPRGRSGHDRTSATERYARFAACMRRHGVKLPAPNTSGKGPIFAPNGFDPHSAAFEAADRRCARELFAKRPTGR